MEELSSRNTHQQTAPSFRLFLLMMLSTWMSSPSRESMPASSSARSRSLLFPFTMALQTVLLLSTAGLLYKGMPASCRARRAMQETAASATRQRRSMKLKAHSSAGPPASNAIARSSRQVRVGEGFSSLDLTPSEVGRGRRGLFCVLAGTDFRDSHARRSSTT